VKGFPVLGNAAGAPSSAFFHACWPVVQYNEGMSTPVLPDVDGLLWGYTQSFWHVLRNEAPPKPSVEERSKWFSFLPSDSFEIAQASFQRLAREILMDPEGERLCHQAKIALSPLHQTPDRLVVVFYGIISEQEALLALVQKHAKAERRRLLQEGVVRARDGFLSKWTFKTDAQTVMEMEAKTSAVHLSRMLYLLGVEVPAHKSRKAAKPG